MTRARVMTLAPYAALGGVQALLIALRASGITRWPWWLVLLPMWVALLAAGVVLGALSMWAGASHE